MLEPMLFRPMRDDDVAAVYATECAACAFPWTDGIFRDCLRVNYACWVGVRAREIVAHGIMSVAVGECHIFNLCVHPEHQRQGLGRCMLRHLLAQALGHRAETAFLEVRATNTAARALYAAEGFCEIGVRRNYYPARKGREDAIVLGCELTGA